MPKVAALIADSGGTRVTHTCHSTLPVGTREVNKAAPFRNSSEHETIAVAADAL